MDAATGVCCSYAGIVTGGKCSVSFQPAPKDVNTANTDNENSTTIASSYAINDNLFDDINQ